MRSRYPSRIVCLTEETTETLYLLGEGDRIVGISGNTVRPPEARYKPKVRSPQTTLLAPRLAQSGGLLSIAENESLRA